METVIIDVDPVSDPPEPILNHRTGLTNKQSKFVDAYIQHQNGPQAAIAAGYSAKSAAVEANRLLKHAGILLELDNWRKSMRKTITRDSFVEKAIGCFDELDVKEPNKPRFLEIAGKTLGYIGGTDQKPNQTMNITNINIEQVNNIGQLSLWDQTRKLIEGT